MSLQDAMHTACDAVGIEPPRSTKPGEWVQTPVKGKGRGNTSGRVLIFGNGSGGICWNWASGQEQRFTANGMAARGEVKAPRRDPEEERKARERTEAAVRASGDMVAQAEQQSHPYLERKGFPEERGLVLENPIQFIPRGYFFDGMRYQLGKMAGPFLIVPGRRAKQVVTVQLIDVHGAKLNMKAAPMSGAAHRIATGRETWVCEGLATALSVRAALRLLGRSATVLSAFSAANVAKVAEGLSGSVIAADHDKPLEQLHGKGTGEFYAAKSGCAWTQPPELGDFNDYHTAHGLRAVALHLKEVRA